MAFDLTKPVDRKDPINAPILADLQGNILKGHGRDHTLHLFLRMKKGAANVKAAKKWFSDFAKRAVTSAEQQFREMEDYRNLKVIGGLFANLLLTSTGYGALGRKPPPDPKFVAGMKASQAQLKDPKPPAWELGYQGDIHAMVLLAHDDISELNEAARKILREVRKFADVVAGERGTAMRNESCDAIEHFGYVDGRSQPLLLTEDIAKEPKSKFDPSAPARLVLVPDPHGKKGVSFGSYLVFRKLEQDVKGFNQAEEDLADALGLVGDKREVAGAMVVGRFEDGTPVVLQDTDGLNHPVGNDFNYGADPNGLRCPFQGHIRKMNPRGGTVSLGATPESERDHRIARRGITYGERCKQPKDEPTIDEMPSKDVGLLFMCFQSDIANQFEFMQQQWANNEGFLKPGTGVDGVIGQVGSGKPAAQKWPDPWGAATTKSFSFQGFVTMKGGEYFFAPSLKFLRGL